MDHEGIMLSEISQMEKINTIWYQLDVEFLKADLVKNREQNGGFQGLGVGGWGNLGDVVWGYKLSTSRLVNPGNLMPSIEIIVNNTIL